MLYVFKNRSACCDVFKHIYETMCDRGYQCLRLIDEQEPNPKLIVDRLPDTDVTLVTSDHLDDDLEHWGMDCYSARDIIDRIGPKKTFFGLHDLGISVIDDELAGCHVLLPSDDWMPLLENKNYIAADAIGWPKFVNADRDVIYNTVFFVSCIYLYARAPRHEFYQAFQKLFEWKVPFKFPDFVESEELYEFTRSHGITIIDESIESFDILLKCHTAISNANSSIAVEAAMAGCNSINIGWSFTPDDVYGRFDITSVNDDHVGGLKEEHLFKNAGVAQKDLVLDTDKAIEIITA